MIAALPIDAESAGSVVALKFSRSRFFAIINKESATYEIIPNPFTEDRMQVGRNVVTHLQNEYKVNTLIAYELGLKAQQIASGRKLTLIILGEKSYSLNRILKMMNIL